MIAHEWIEPRGGSEHVAAAIANAFPGSEVLTPWANSPERFEGHRVRETWVAASPLRGRKALSALVLPFVWRTAVPADVPYEWIIASTHLFSHHVRGRGLSEGALKLVYVHSPARYIWNPELDPRGRSSAARLASLALKPIDRRRAGEADSIAANSAYVQERVRRAWGRESRVIYPPVAVEAIQQVADWVAELDASDQAVFETLPDDFILGASRFVSYKRLDDVLRAGAASSLPVVLAGGGPEERRLRALAAELRVSAHFVIDPSTTLLYALLQRARTLVFPAIEDFGMIPVEAMAAGTPVIGPTVGGTGETIRDGVSGRLLDHFEPSSIVDAINDVAAIPGSSIRSHAQRFATSRFRLEVQRWLQDEIVSAASP